MLAGGDSSVVMGHSSGVRGLGQEAVAPYVDCNLREKPGRNVENTFGGVWLDSRDGVVCLDSRDRDRDRFAKMDWPE